MAAGVLPARGREGGRAARAGRGGQSSMSGERQDGEADCRATAGPRRLCSEMGAWRGGGKGAGRRGGHACACGGCCGPCASHTTVAARSSGGGPATTHQHPLLGERAARQHEFLLSAHAEGPRMRLQRAPCGLALAGCESATSAWPSPLRSPARRRSPRCCYCRMIGGGAAQRRRRESKGLQPRTARLSARAQCGGSALGKEMEHWERA